LTSIRICYVLFLLDLNISIQLKLTFHFILKSLSSHNFWSWLFFHRPWILFNWVPQSIVRHPRFIHLLKEEIKLCLSLCSIFILVMPCMIFLLGRNYLCSSIYLALFIRLLATRLHFILQLISIDIISASKTSEFIDRDRSLDLENVLGIIEVLTVHIIHHKVPLLLPWITGKTDLVQELMTKTLVQILKLTCELRTHSNEVFLKAHFDRSKLSSKV
jgi:hypothetical protein